MGKLTKIQWTDHTFNPWIGCTKIAEGCANCYAEAQRKRFGKNEWGPGVPRTLTTEKYWDKPKAWSIDAMRDGDRRRVFCASMADVFDPEVPDEWRARLFKLIFQTRNWLDWQLLTKRPGEWREATSRACELLHRESKTSDDSDARACADGAHSWFNRSLLTIPSPPSNVWLGVSVANQADADRNIPILREIPAEVRFISVEPLIGPVDLSAHLSPLDWAIDWVIVGGESGPRARPCDVAWIRSIVEQCWSADVPCFVKQLGSRPMFTPEHDGATGGFLRLRDPKGGDPDEWPEGLRERETP